MDRPCSVGKCWDRDFLFKKNKVIAVRTGDKERVDLQLAPLARHVMDGKPESLGVGLQMTSAKYQLTFGQHQLVPGSISFLLISFSSTAGQHTAESTIEENTSNKLST